MKYFDEMQVRKSHLLGDHQLILLLLEVQNNEVISINIDTGCCYGGKLTAMIIDDEGKYTFEMFPWEE